MRQHPIQSRKILVEMSDSESEYEQEQEIIPPPSQEEQRIREERVKAFRNTVLKWKKQLLNSITEDKQDTLVLEIFRNELSELFYLIRDVLEGQEPDEELVKHDIWKHIEKYFPLEDAMERIDLTHLLYRDLVEFPFTFNSKLVNAFLKKNSLEDAEILPNK